MKLNFFVSGGGMFNDNCWNELEISLVGLWCSPGSCWDGVVVLKVDGK